MVWASKTILLNYILKVSKRSAGREDFTAVQQAGGRGAAQEEAEVLLSQPGKQPGPCKEAEEPRGAQPSPEEGRGKSQHHPALHTHTTLDVCSDLCREVSYTTPSHTQPQCSVYVRGIFPLLSRFNILGEVRYAKHVYALWNSRALAVGLGKTGATSHAMISPVGCNDLTAVWVAAAPGVHSEIKPFIVWIGVFHFIRVMFGGGKKQERSTLLWV